MPTHEKSTLTPDVFALALLAHRERAQATPAELAARGRKSSPGLTQQEAADRLGVRRNRLQAWESGKAPDPLIRSAILDKIKQWKAKKLK